MLQAVRSAVQAWASELGGLGLFIIAALDSSFMSFPQVNDLLVMFLSSRYPARMPYYATMTTLGSLLGCFALYFVARRGGESFLRRRFSGARVNRALALYERHGLLAVVVPSLLPPPVPFKLFVLLAGAARVSPLQFGAAVVLGRSIRYFGQGYLAVLYGEQAAALARAHSAVVGIGLAALALAVGITYYLWQRRREREAPPDRTADNPNTGAGNRSQPS
jgi:membrane protein DedA with SNARE-associated domain